MKDPMKVLDVGSTAFSRLVDERVTCPFLGSAIATSKLPVRNDVDNPHASIEDLRRLGNTGGGDLIDVLIFLANENHALMRGSADKLDENVPYGLFSGTPGSQGSHPGIAAS